MDVTSGEFKIMFDAHEKRDNERFQEGKESLKESLDDVVISASTGTFTASGTWSPTAITSNSGFFMAAAR